MQAVATASGDKSVRLWGLADGACLRTFEGHTASALRCCFLSAGTQARAFPNFPIRATMCSHSVMPSLRSLLQTSLILWWA